MFLLNNKWLTILNLYKRIKYKKPKKEKKIFKNLFMHVQII